LWGQGFAFKEEEEDESVVGMEVGGSGSCWVEEGSVDGGDVEGCGGEDCGRGVVFVGPLLTNVVISSGVLAYVTLSMNCHAGSTRTRVLWSEWSGIGMSDADSIRRYTHAISNLLSVSFGVEPT
jgi:hypothetical protein